MRGDGPSDIFPAERAVWTTFLNASPPLIVNS